MITINLLPYHLRPIKHSLLPYLISGAVLIIVVLSIAAAFVSSQAKIAHMRNDLAQHKGELQSLSGIVKEYNGLVEQKRRLADKLSTINGIVRDRIIWSRQLWNLSRLAPRNFWYDAVSVDLKAFKEKQTIVDPKTGNEQVKDVTVKKPVMTLEGYVIESEFGKFDVSPLLLNLENDTEFSGLFQLQSYEMEDTEYEGYPVRRFSIQYLIAPGGAKR